MDQKSLAKWLKAILIGVGICGILIYALFLPFTGRCITGEYPEFSSWFYPWLVFLWITALPCYGVLVLGWRIASNIGKNHSFTMQNGTYLKWISILAAGDSLFFFAGNLLYWIWNINYPVIVILSVVVTFFGMAVSVAAAALSHLVAKAADLQEQSDWTI